MTVTPRAPETFRITATAVSPAADLAIGSVASLLGIEPRKVAERLASFPSVLARQVPGPRARRLSAMLTLLGLRVRLDPGFSGHPGVARRLDLALLPSAGADCDVLAQQLASLLGARPDLRAELERPGGLVLSGRTDAEAGALRKALCRLKDVRVLASDPDTALFDLFARRSPRLLGLASRLGLTSCRVSGAAVGGVNLATGCVLLRAAGQDALLLDRAFQRFDLMLQAAPENVPADLADFLSTRAGQERVPVRGGLQLPQRVDCDLPRTAALRFIADYAAMGLQVSPRLRGKLPPELRHNP